MDSGHKTPGLVGASRTGCVSGREVGQGSHAQMDDGRADGQGPTLIWVPHGNPKQLCKKFTSLKPLCWRREMSQEPQHSRPICSCLPSPDIRLTSKGCFEMAQPLLHLILTRHPEPEPSCTVVFSFLTCRNCVSLLISDNCCLKPLSLGVIGYTATGNRNRFCRNGPPILKGTCVQNTVRHVLFVTCFSLHIHLSFYDKPEHW